MTASEIKRFADALNDALVGIRIEPEEAPGIYKHAFATVKSWVSEEKLTGELNGEFDIPDDTPPIALEYGEKEKYTTYSVVFVGEEDEN